MKIKHFWPLFCTILPLIFISGFAFAQVNSGSDGSDGVFNPTTSLVIDLHDHPNGIYQFTSVNIPSGVTITFIPNAKNTPVTWLVQNNCVVNGTVILSGQQQSSGVGGVGGPGGWAGGSGGSNPSSGQGPGGGGPGIGNSVTSGGSYGTIATAPQSATIPPAYGNSFVLPLLGGSGGGGFAAPIDDNPGGGGGGGAILIASSSSILLNGTIVATGGGSAGNWGGGGSGGAVRLVAVTITGVGTIDVRGGAGSYGYGGFLAGQGRIRFDAFQSSFGGSTFGVFTQGFQPIIIPVSGQGAQLTIASIGGVAVSANPSGVLVTPDAVISGAQTNPISVVVNCSNLPLNTPVTVTVNPANGTPVSAIGNNTAGTLASSTATISLNMPRGGGIVFATAAVSN